MKENRQKQIQIFIAAKRDELKDKRGNCIDVFSFSPKEGLIRIENTRIWTKPIQG
jgi:hypothetical protein